MIAMDEANFPTQRRETLRNSNNPVKGTYSKDYTKVKVPANGNQNDFSGPKPVLNYASNVFKVSNLMFEPPQ